METLTSCSSAAQANIIKWHLENEGIHAQVVNQDSQLLSPTAFIDPYSIRILVEEKDLARASKILENTYPQMIKCPFCGAGNSVLIDDNAGKNTLSLIIAHILGKNKTHFQCSDCGADFFKKE